MAHWFGFAAVAGAFGGILAFAIQQANLIGGLHGHNWKLLFIVEGIYSLFTPFFINMLSRCSCVLSGNIYHLLPAGPS